MPTFDAKLYRLNSQDLRHLDDRALESHFDRHGGKERRVFSRTETTAELMSMRWLRGRGIEIGAGRNPTPLFGDATCVHADISSATSFGGSAQYILDLGRTPAETVGEFDFAIAAHVLEHCDSFIRGLSNLLSAVNEKGAVYVVLPDKRYLFDQNWLPDFDFDHHLAEWRDPLANADMHDRLFLGSLTTDVRFNEHAEFSDELAEALERRELPADQRFLAHKHNYRFSDWIRLVDQSLTAMQSPFRIEDCAFGRERMDCHFILAR